MGETRTFYSFSVEMINNDSQRSSSYDTVISRRRIIDPEPQGFSTVSSIKIKSFIHADSWGIFRSCRYTSKKWYFSKSIRTIFDF